MRLAHHHGGKIIVFSFVAAFILAMLPLPDWAELFRPEWVTLVLIYWCLALPERVGVGIGWLLGLVLDVIHGSLLGQYALGLAVVAYLALQLHQRIRVYPLWQQAFTILMLTALQQMLVLWVKGVTGHSPNTWLYWLPTLTSSLLWPWTFLLLRDLRRRFKVS